MTPKFSSFYLYLTLTWPWKGRWWRQNSTCKRGIGIYWKTLDLQSGYWQLWTCILDIGKIWVCLLDIFKGAIQFTVCLVLTLLWPKRVHISKLCDFDNLDIHMKNTQCYGNNFLMAQYFIICQSVPIYESQMKHCIRFCIILGSFFQSPSRQLCPLEMFLMVSWHPWPCEHRIHGSIFFQ